MAIPAGGLLAGCAIGVCWPDLPAAPFDLLVIASAAVAVVSWWSSRAGLLVAAVVGGFAGGGVLLASEGWRDAWRPTLRSAFEAMARDARTTTNMRADRAPPEDMGVAVVLVGVLRADALPKAAGGPSLHVDVQRIEPVSSTKNDAAATTVPVEGGVLLSVAGLLGTERAGEWRAGRTIRTTAHLHRPGRYLDPAVPDQERALARRGITLVGTVKSGALVEIVSRGHWPAEIAAALRAFTRRAVATTVGRFSARSQAIVTAILIGDRSGLDATVERRLQEAGTYHVIAISGGNIAILAGLTLFFFRVAGLLGRAAMVTAIAGLGAYCYVVGGGASVDRATLMAAAYFSARALDLRAPPLNILALSAGFLAAGDPLTVADPGFLLTLGATTSILLLLDPQRLAQLPKLVAPVAAVFLASAAAEAALLPIVATLFARVTFAGLALNLFAIPLMTAAQLAGMLAVATSLVTPALAAFPGWVAHIGAEGLVRSAELVNVAPFVTWRVAPPSVLVVVAYYLGAIGCWTLWRHRTRVSGSLESPRLRTLRRGSALTAACAALWMLAEPWTLLTSRGDGQLHVTFVDVGQGDAAIVRFPRGATLLVDAGGLSSSPLFDIGDRVVAPVLRNLGVRRLDALALTHGDADHVGGAEATLLEFRPREVWEGIPVPPAVALQRLRGAALSTRTAWRNVHADDVVRVDGVVVAVRHPGIADWERQDVRNDDSIVLELLWRDVSIVLTGDIGREVETAIASRFSQVPLRVIKVPHHGSLSSSSEPFVRALAPRVAVVSAGRRNPFGHPAPAVLERYQSVGAEVFRTDRDGAVTVDTDGTSLEVSCFTGRRLRINEEPRKHENTIVQP